jgi:uncharacterized protein (DUF2252 family)
LNAAPAVWVCGDLHLENFGSYKGDNRLSYFDINDFDEAALAPCSWDLTRFLTSILVGARTLQVNEPEALALCNCALDAYASALSIGHAHTVERETAVGMVEDLLISLKQRDRKDFLNERTEQERGQRRLKIDSKKTLAVTKVERDKVKTLLEVWSTKQAEPDFFQLLDVARRIAGTGSLGVERYVLLVEGNGSPNKNYLLDLKLEPGSALQPYLKLPQPQWSNQAERVVAIQKRMQGTSPALISTLEDDGKSYVLRELQPIQDRVNLNQWNGKLRRLEKVMQTMGELIAWAQLRSSGRQGSAIADELINFGQDQNWRRELLDYAQKYSIQVETDYQSFWRGF